MPKPVIVPNPQTQQDWKLLRQGIARCIEAVAPTAKVYERWPLRLDIGKTAEILISTADSNKIHSWIVGINRALPYNDRNSDGLVLWDLTVRIWGFLGYEYGTDDDNPYNVMESEIKKIVHVFMANREHLSLDNTQSLKDVGIPQFEDIETQGFGNEDLIVAQGTVAIKLIEFL